jgi:hypothetical protein
MKLKKNQRFTAMYCDVIIKRNKIPLIIDSEAAKSIITHHFLSKLEVQIDQPSNTFIVNINGKRKILLGEVLNFSIVV